MNYVRVTEYKIGRTVSPSGKDKYFGIGFGLSFDTRDLLEYSTKGYYLNTNYTRYGYINDEINYGKFNIESQSYLQFSFSDKYYISVASRLFTSLSVGNIIPYYNHVYLGYGDDYVRGWLKKGFEGNDKLTLYNEIRIPLLTPRYINAKELPIVKFVPYINKFDLKYGLYLTLLYDIGAVWNNYDRLSGVGFMSGTGLGLNAVLPFGYVARLDWAFPITKPSVGQVVFTLNAKF